MQHVCLWESVFAKYWLGWIKAYFVVCSEELQVPLAFSQGARPRSFRCGFCFWSGHHLLASSHYVLEMFIMLEKEKPWTNPGQAIGAVTCSPELFVPFSEGQPDPRSQSRLRVRRRRLTNRIPSEPLQGSCAAQLRVYAIPCSMLASCKCMCRIC